jgi:hypothetical protein
VISGLIWTGILVGVCLYAHHKYSEDEKQAMYDDED